MHDLLAVDKLVTTTSTGPMIRRILIVAGNYPPNIVGGGEIATRMLANGFADLGIEVRVLTCSEVQSSYKDGETAIVGIKSPNIYWRYSHAKPNAKPRSTIKKAAWQLLDNYNPRTISVVTAAIAEFQPDVVLTSILENFGAAAWLAAYRTNTPVVDIIHSYYLQCIRASRFKAGKTCTKPCVGCHVATLGKRHLSKYVSGAVGVSRYILQAHIAEGYFPNSRHTYIYNPIEGQVTEARRLYRSGTPTFGYLGKLLPTKGIEELLHAFKDCRLAGRLVVAGDGEPSYEAHLRQSAVSDSIDFVGWVDPDQLFDRIDFLLFPSLWHEPFGRGVAEAMSRGIPVIGARRGGIPEIIDHGQDGFLYDPVAPGELEKAITLALQSDYSSLSIAALRKSEMFSARRIIDQYVHFLEDVVAQRDIRR